MARRVKTRLVVDGRTNRGARALNAMGIVAGKITQNVLTTLKVIGLGDSSR